MQHVHLSLGEEVGAPVAGEGGFEQVWALVAMPTNYFAVQPPSMEMVVPVIERAQSEAR